MNTKQQNKITEEERQKRIEAVQSSLANHAIERIYPSAKVTEVFNKYIDGDYDMEDVIDILVHKRD